MYDMGSPGDARPGGGGLSHFGLALAYYTHFTSPIRRYADVVVHRQLIAALGSPDAVPPLRHSNLQQVTGKHTPLRCIQLCPNSVQCIFCVTGYIEHP